MSDTKLKPCPFCGGEAKLRKLNKDRGYFVLCSKCGCRTPYFKYRYAPIDDLREDAIDTWNTRKPIDRIVGQLEQQAEQYRRRSVEAEQKGFSRESDKYYGKQCSYLHATELVKAGGIDD